MTVSLDFTIVDVFSDRAFGGNQLAVFPQADGISDATMQRLAREFNFAETTFVLPPGDPAHTCRVRIFTPHAELPFAGHPTVGTAAVLASLDEDHPGTERRFVFEEGIGPVTVTADGKAARLYLQSPERERAAESPQAAAIARALSLPETAVVRTWYAGLGVRFCFVHLADAGLVDRAVLDRTAWKAGVANGWSPHLYLFAGECRDGGRLYARMFAPALGVDEDPATGSAGAALIASLADDSPSADGSYRLQIDQGVSMSRPSLIEAAAQKEHGRLAEVTVGGHATIVGHGVITLGSRRPPDAGRAPAGRGGRARGPGAGAR
jgi:trans-2,3-dihydro-3-hydroxyanthranilate isomerase